VAALLSNCARGEGTVGRYGGEEFAVIMSGTDSATAVRAAEALRAAVRESPIDTRSGPLTVTVSLGVAALQQGDDVPTVLARADAALYRAKSAGRDQVCVDPGSERPVAYR
jgi:eukaryotic-like serine/threonine-protein kinase